MSVRTRNTRQWGSVLETCQKVLGGEPPPPVGERDEMRNRNTIDTNQRLN